MTYEKTGEGNRNFAREVRRMAVVEKEMEVMEKKPVVSVHGNFRWSSFYGSGPGTAQRKRVTPKNTRGTQVDVKRS